MFMNKLNTNCLFSSAEKEVFTLLKIATISPIIRYSDAYRPISFLPKFSKVFERITYNRFFDYLHKNKLFFEGDLSPKQ